MRANCLWVCVSSEAPFKEWWTKCAQEQNWPRDLLIERWNLADTPWSKVMDSLRSFTLFGQKKALVLFQAEKALKADDESRKLVEILKKAPHLVVLVSSENCPLEIDQWAHTSADISEIDDRVAFKWIDAIHSRQLSLAISSLEEALANDQHPLSLIQLLNRDFRLGRLIHHGQKCRIQQPELVRALKVPPFLIQKWSKRADLSRSTWEEVFEMLFRADLAMKSGGDGTWILRKLTLDLIQLSQSKNRAKKVKPSWKPAPLLWTNAPSFA